MRLNKWGNSYPEGAEIYEVEVLSDKHICLKKGDKLNVMESLNPYFKGMWRVSDSVFIPKHFCSEPI